MCYNFFIGFQITLEKIHHALSKKPNNTWHFSARHFKKPKHQSDGMCQRPWKKPNIEKKTPKTKAKQFFWRQVSLKKAKFVKFGVKKTIWQPCDSTGIENFSNSSFMSGRKLDAGYGFCPSKRKTGYGCWDTTPEIRDEHRSGLVRTGSGLDPLLARSGLDRTAIFFQLADQDWIGLRKLCCFNGIILTKLKILVAIRFYRFVKW